MQEFKSGFVSIIGRTNAGKSTLINYLSNEKISITTYKPQTTRTAIRAIINRENSQIIFVDTPGLHKPKNKYGNKMVDLAKEQAVDSDIVLFLIDGSRKSIDKEEEQVLLYLKEKKKKAILVINKIDLLKKEELVNRIEMYKDRYDFTAIFPISSTKGKERDKEELLIEIEKLLKPGPKYYDEEEYTDQTERQIVEEVIREKALKLLDQEIPHGIYVEVEKMKERKTIKQENIYDIDCVIYCIRNSHKGIIIGKNGEMLKRIGQYARQDLEKMFNIKINLKIWVKTREDWQDKA